MPTFSSKHRHKKIKKIQPVFQGDKKPFYFLHTLFTGY